ncbi:hypothetical protein QCA50_000864 [Cerrena zonata]|uniref:Uncharacterized protein n=1 Tax=Cerrena zonata TaxID=2478898 RepID=A0AAW0H0H3_9APHY
MAERQSSEESEDTLWLITTQGACVSGVEPEGLETMSWAFCTFLREALFAMPIGVSKLEYDYWVVGLGKEWERNASEQDEVSKMDFSENETMGDIPILLYRFIFLLNLYKRTGTPFDLRDVFDYENTKEPNIMYDDIPIIIDEGSIYIPRWDWIDRTVKLFNGRREKRNMPLLEMDCNLASQCAISAFSNRLNVVAGVGICALGGSPCPAKLPEQDGQSDEGEDREEEEEVEEEETDAASLQEQEDVVMGEEDVQVEDDNDSEEPPIHQVEVQTAETKVDDHRYNLRDRALVKRTTREPTIASSKGKAVEVKKAVKRRKKPILVSSDDEDDASLSSLEEVKKQVVPLIHLARQEVYWTGSHRLADHYWVNIQVHARIGRYQIALISCKSCARRNLPCLIYLDVAPGCIACIKGKHSCSFVPLIGDGRTHVKIPYSIVICKLFHCKQISLLMQGLPLNIQPRRIQDVHFGKGIPHGTQMTPLDKDVVKAVKKGGGKYVKKVSKQKWKMLWYGVQYPEINAAYDHMQSRSKQRHTLLDGAMWDIQDGLTKREWQFVDEYYALIDEVTKDPNWTAWDVFKRLGVLPTLNIRSADGSSASVRNDPSTFGIGKDEWMDIAEGDRVLEVYVSDDEDESMESDTGGADVESEDSAHPEGSAASGDRSSTASNEDDADSEKDDDEEDELDDEDGEEQNVASSQESVQSLLSKIEVPPKRSCLKAIVEVPTRLEALPLSDEEQMEIDDGAHAGPSRKTPEPNVIGQRSPSGPLLSPSNLVFTRQAIKTAMKSNMRRQQGPVTFNLGKQVETMRKDASTGGRTERDVFEDGPRDDVSSRSETPQRDLDRFEFLSPIRQELQRKGTSLTIESAQAINRAISTRFSSLNDRLAHLEAAAQNQTASTELAETIKEAREWFDDVRRTYPENERAIQTLKDQHDAFQRELQRAEAEFQDYRQDTKQQIEQLVKQQVEHFLSQIRLESAILPPGVQGSEGAPRLPPASSRPIASAMGGSISSRSHGTFHDVPVGSSGRSRQASALPRRAPLPNLGSSVVAAQVSTGLGIARASSEPQIISTSVKTSTPSLPAMASVASGSSRPTAMPGQLQDRQFQSTSSALSPLSALTPLSRNTAAASSVVPLRDSISAMCIQDSSTRQDARNTVPEQDDL